MTEEKKRKSPKGYGLLVLALVILTNPQVTVFDYLPDFIGCLIFARALRFFADRAPYFEEARSGFMKLAIVSIAKIPSYFIMIYARGVNVMDYDVNSLFAFTFSAIDLLILLPTLKNLFSAFSYLGERSECAALISDYKISKRGRLYSPEKLKTLCFAFAIYKAAATALPEMLLLTRSVSAEDFARTFNFARLYPYVIIIAVVSVFVFGITVTKRTAGYLKAILKDGNIKLAAEGLLDEGARASLKKKLMLRGMNGALSVFVVTAFLTVDICFDNLLEINLLPHFIYGTVMIFGAYRLSKYAVGAKRVYVAGALYVVSAIATYVLSVGFLTEHGYEALAMMNDAKDSYVRVMIASAAEFATAIILLVTVAVMLKSFILEHTGLAPSSDRYSRTDADYHKQMTKRIYIWTSLGAFTALTKLVDAVQRFYSTNKFISADMNVVIATSGLIPWFSVVMIAANVAYIGYSLHLFSKLKEDIELKYT